MLQWFGDGTDIAASSLSPNARQQQKTRHAAGLIHAPAAVARGRSHQPFGGSGRLHALPADFEPVRQNVKRTNQAIQ
jgi:hypothetical protein